jgi:hypothetical protein
MGEGVMMASLFRAAALLALLSGCESLPGPKALAVNEPGFDVSKIAETNKAGIAAGCWKRR